MAIGDDALAAGMDVVDPSTDLVKDGADEINKTRDYLAQKTADVTPLAKGGTGATNAAGARANLGLGTAATWDQSTAPIEGTLVTRGGGGRIAVGTPVDANNAATKGYVDGLVTNKATLGADVTFGHIYTPGATPATSGYTVAYINVDGRIGKGASSERFKTDIDRDPDLPDVFAIPISAYAMREDPDKVIRYGPIAEDLGGNPATAGFVVYDAEGRPESFDMLSYLMAAVATLHKRVRELEQ